jgi:hypothetical protein
VEAAAEVQERARSWREEAGKRNDEDTDDDGAHEESMRAR